MLIREYKELVFKNVEGLNNESGVVKKCEFDIVEISNSIVILEKKIEFNEVCKFVFFLEKNLVKDSKDFLKEVMFNVMK